MRKASIFAVLLAMSSVSYAEQWQILGTRPMGMGGAFVAVAQGPIAQYWNPAGLYTSTGNVSGMELPVGVNAEFTGDIVKNASQIGDLAAKYSAIQNAQNTGGAVNAEQMAAFAKTLSLMSDMNEPGNGALLQIAGGANFKFSKMALSVNNFTSVGLNPFIDTVNVGLNTAAGGIAGVNFVGSDPTDKSGTYGAAYTAAYNSINTALTTIDYNNIQALVCGTAGCLVGQGIANQNEFAYALINKALVTDGLTLTQVTEAANTLAQYAADVAPIIAGANSGASYANNTSNLTVVGASFFEIAAGYAWDLKMLPGLSLGANLKMINGRTTATSFRFLSESDTADAFKMNDLTSSWKPGADLGLLWNVNNKYPRLPFSPRVGLVMRNINSPSFKIATGGDYDLNRQTRLGFALNPARFWTLALDVDLTKNKTPVNGFDSRQLAMGTEINIINRKAFNIPLRAGLMKNLAEKDSKMAYTLGAGLNLLHLHIDVSGVVSTERTEIDGKKYPTKVGAAASLGLLF